ncbi:MAG: tRNA-dihydrouridine synthase [bacterium]|nr:tRNA-dihydrouridine synthase [bacterium]
MSNFWAKLPKPFFALAPLEDVTDAAFRRLIARYGKSDVMFTEFTSADGLFFANESGQEKLRAKLLFSDSERPIVAQLFTSSPERMKKGAEHVAKLGFDGVDINMGCPDRAVEKSGCGAALIKNPKLARELIRAAGESGLPVSVKTRTGYLADELDTWLPELLAENLSAVTLHARTRKEMSDVPARWDAVARAVKIHDSFKSKTLIIGNGDVRDIADARAKAEASGCDGVMLGRAIFGNPFLFRHSAECANVKEAKLKALSEHVQLFEELLSKTSSYSTLKKHFASYIKGWGGAKELRTRLMNTENTSEAQAIISGAILGA